LLKAGAGFAKNFLTGRVLPSNSKGLEHVAAGTGDVVSIDGHKAAAFRDENGSVRAVSPICTHRGCQVQFNNAERTWDCPCHGSRYDVEGKVIHGPAVRDLVPLDVKATPRSSSG
jgi:Rieske Fe-S protein